MLPLRALGVHLLQLFTRTCNLDLEFIIVIYTLGYHGKSSMSIKEASKAMKNSVVRKSVMYTVDLTKIDGDGAFPCPKCGVVISPDDETEEIYTIVETKVENDELVELILMCSNCGNKIRLTGFLSQSE